MKRYKVTLTTEERCELRDLIAAGNSLRCQEVWRDARILLKADAPLRAALLGPTNASPRRYS